ncbi:hypothetical protein WJX74_003164 [Apatococcus lobatus]|uniref:F-box domain-containing protein n=1 Tax=Apatococcus lobatus TaxID=904363 RepID=A0AAW1R3J8_9CHLO
MMASEQFELFRSPLIGLADAGQLDGLSGSAAASDLCFRCLAGRTLAKGTAFRQKLSNLGALFTSVRNMADYLASWDCLPLHVQVQIVRSIPFCAAKLELKRVASSWRSLMLEDVHETALDWKHGEPVAVAKQMPASLELPPQLSVLKLQPPSGGNDQDLDLSALPSGLKVLQIASFCRVTAASSITQDPPFISTHLTQSELAILSFSGPLHKPAGVDNHGKLHQPTVLIQATAGLNMPLPIASTLKILVLKTLQLSHSILQHHWPQLQSLSLSFAGIECPNPDQQACHLPPRSFPQLQQLMLGSSDPSSATGRIDFIEQLLLSSGPAAKPASASSLCSGFQREETCMDISGLCTHLAAFASLRRLHVMVPCWDVPAIPLPEGCSLEIGACQAGYRGCSGIRCRFTLEHLIFGCHVLCSLTHLRLRLMHSVGVPPDDSCILDLSPLTACSQLVSLVIAVEKGLQRAWSIGNLGKLPPRVRCRVDLCPVSLAPSITEALLDAWAPKDISILRLAGPPC